MKNDNAQGEYYLPDVIGILQAEGALVSAYVTDDFSETLGLMIVLSYPKQNASCDIVLLKAYAKRRNNYQS